MIRFLTPKKRGEINMTEGNILVHIITFAIPLFIGNIFQQMYNMVDAWVVGNYVSNEAFAAVGTTAPIINMLIGIFMGLSTGAGIIISQYYGARNDEKVSEAVHTSLVLTFILAIVFTVAGYLLAPVMVDFMKTPANVAVESVTYLRIYFLGIIGLMFYNMGAGILRAVGDSQKPFYFIVICAVINTVLDLVFVLVFDMGVDGVAYATIISQFVCAVLVILTLLKTKSSIKIYFSKMKLELDMLKKIVLMGFPLALQMGITSFSNVFVQSYINCFGDNVMSGYTAYGKIDQFVLAPMNALSLATSTFVGQNIGRGLVDRAKRGIHSAFYACLLTMFVIAIPILLFAEQMVGFFNGKPEVIEYGALFLRILTPFYIPYSVQMILAAGLKGAGDTTATMLIMIFSFVVFRQIYLYVMANYISNTVINILLGYPLGWVVACIITVIYYKIRGLVNKKKVTNSLS